MISNHLRKLLEKQNRVIVPELGAFLLKGEDGKSVYFNEFLRFNDGLLLSYVADQEHIEVLDAAHLIKTFVDETNRKLQAERSVVIENIGRLYIDSNDKIQIENLFPIENVNEQYIIGKDEQDDIGQKLKNKIPNNGHGSKIDASGPIENNYEIANNENEKKGHDTSNEQISTVSLNNNTVNTNPLFPILNVRNVFAIAGTLFIILVLILLLLNHQEKQRQNIRLGGTVKDTTFEKLSMINTNKALPVLTTKSKQENINQSDSEISALKSKPPLENSTSKSELSKPEPVKPSNSKNTGSKSTKFYIVAGCFSNKLNAINLVTKLKSEGHLSEEFTIINNLHYVCFAFYYDKDSASKELNKLKEKGEVNPWIMIIK